MPVCCCRMLIVGINSHPILWTENTSYRLTCRNDVAFLLGFCEFSAQEAVLSSGFCAVARACYHLMISAAAMVTEGISILP